MLKTLLAFIFFLFACEPAISDHSILLWKISMLATEWSLWWSVLSLSLLIYCIRHSHRNGWSALQIVLLSLSFAFFTRPFLDVSRFMPEWKRQMDVTWGPSTAISPNWARLIYGGMDLENKPEIIKYLGDGNESHQLDFFRSAHSADHSAPWVVVIPGGSWESSDRKPMWELNAYLATLGYSVAVVSYRTAPAVRWPGQRNDILQAISYLQTHAQDLGIDPAKFVILGRSAGAQLAESITYGKPPTGLRGGIFFYGPSDMAFADRFSDAGDSINSKKLLHQYLGGLREQNHAIYDEASPIRFISGASLPALLLHGSHDSLVWRLHSQRLFGKLTTENVPAVLIEFPWAEHGFDYNFAGPGTIVSTYALERFLHGVL